jgi:hypothetical protein
MEFLLHVTKGSWHNFIPDHWSTICIGFVPMIWTVVLVGQCENMQLLSLQFQLYGSSKKVLTQKVVTILEEAGFSFNYSCVQSLFGSQLSSPSNLHVLAMSVHNIVRSTNASCWPTTHGGKKVRRPSVFKIT